MTDNQSPIDRMFGANAEKHREQAIMLAQRTMGESGVWTMTLTVNPNTGRRIQRFASMNAVSNERAKLVAIYWLQVKYGNIQFEFTQSAGERQASTLDRLYFHATFTPINLEQSTGGL